MNFFSGLGCTIFRVQGFVTSRVSFGLGLRVFRVHGLGPPGVLRLGL